MFCKQLVVALLAVTFPMIEKSQSANNQPLPIEAKDSAAASEPAAHQNDVSIEVRFVGVPDQMAMPLIQKFRSTVSEDTSSAVKQLDTLLAAGKAQLFGIANLTTRSGQQAEHQDIEEVLYAKEFEPGATTVEIPQEAGNAKTPSSNDVKTEQAPFATNFELRNIGMMVTCEPVLSPNGETIEVNLQVQHDRLKSFDHLTTERLLAGEKTASKVIQEVPRFTKMKVTTSQQFRSGESRLIGVFRSPDAKGELEFFVMTVEHIGKSPSPSPPPAKSP